MPDRYNRKAVTPPLRNEVDATDNTDHAAEAPMGFAVMLIAGLHVLCCGLSLLLLSGVSLATILPSWPVLGGALALVGLVGFVWYLRNGCTTCPSDPKHCRNQLPQNTG